MELSKILPCMQQFTISSKAALDVLVLEEEDVRVQWENWWRGHHGQPRWVWSWGPPNRPQCHGIPKKIRLVLLFDQGYQACWCTMPWKYFSKWWGTVHVAQVGSNADRPDMVWSVSKNNLLAGCVLIVLVILTVLTINIV